MKQDMRKTVSEDGIEIEVLKSDNRTVIEAQDYVFDITTNLANKNDELTTIILLREILVTSILLNRWNHRAFDLNNREYVKDQYKQIWEKGNYKTRDEILTKMLHLLYELYMNCDI